MLVIVAQALDDLEAALQKLASMKERGVITDDEYKTKRQKLMED